MNGYRTNKNMVRASITKPKTNSGISNITKKIRKKGTMGRSEKVNLSDFAVK